MGATEVEPSDAVGGGVSCREPDGGSLSSPEAMESQPNSNPVIMESIHDIVRGEGDSVVALSADDGD